jgi:hypothetical protein
MNRHRCVRSGALVLVGMLAVSASAFAAVVHVPGDQPTIQAGIDAAAAGDTVLVAPGTYQGSGNTNLVFGGIDRVLRSSGGADVTLIDCQLAARGILMLGGESPATVVEGFTIRNGLLDDDGGAIYCHLADPTLRDCHFIDNSADSGGALWISSGSPVVTGCTFRGNDAGGNSTYAGHGGAIWCANVATPVITGCVFEDNMAKRGGAIWCSGNASPLIEDCTFTDNVAQSMGGAIMSFGETSHPQITGSDFTGNAATSVGGAVAILDSEPTFEECRFIDNLAGTRGGACFANGGMATYTRCVFDRNSAGAGAAVQVLDGDALLDGCTLYASDGALGGALHVWNASAPASASIENTIIAFGTAGEAVRCEGGATATASCTDVFGNAGGDWVGCLSGQLGVAGNIAGDPLFCDAAGGDLGIDESSPCAPPQSGSCGLIGALPAGCGTTAIAGATTPAPAVTLRAIPNPLRSAAGFIEWSGGGDAVRAVTLRLHDPLGRLVLRHDLVAGGEHQRIAWSRILGGRDLPSGVYFLSIEGLPARVAPLRLVWTR